MKILYFYQYFTTPKGSYGTRVYEFTKKWVELGHDVTVVTSVYYKSDIKASKFIETQKIDGITVKIININIDNKQSFLKRVFSFILFMFFSVFFALKIKSDIVISSSGPITAVIPGIFSKFFKKSKLIVEVRDLLPEVAIELGVLKNKILISLSYSLESFMYKYADHIIALSEGMSQNIKKRFDLDNITTVTNAANINLFSKKIKNPKLFGLEPKKYAIYTGNIGHVNNSFLLYKAALHLRKIGNKELKIVLVGDGQQKNELSNLISQNNLKNILIIDPLPKKELVSLIQNALVSLVPLSNNKILNTSSPNKFFESLSSGVPIIQTTDGWMKEFLQKHNLGYSIKADDYIKLSELIIKLSESENNLHQIQERALRLSRKLFSKEKLAVRMLDAIIINH